MGQFGGITRRLPTGMSFTGEIASTMRWVSWGNEMERSLFDQQAAVKERG